MEARTVFAWALLAVLGLVTWLMFQPFLSWLLATGLLAFVFAPLHRRLERRIGARLSAGLLTVLVVLVVVVPTAFLVNEALTRAPRLLNQLSQAGGFRRLGRIVERYTGMSLPIESYVRRGAGLLTNSIGERASLILSGAFHATIGFFLFLFVFYYLLKDGERLVGWVKETIPLAPSVRDELFRSGDDMTRAVLKGHVLVAMVQGAVAGVSLFVTGVPEALLLTVAMMLLAIVPVIGLSPVMGGAVVYLFLNGQVLSAAFVVIWGLTTVAVTDDYLRALIIDRESEMHPAMIVVGVVGGTYLLGVMGLFVGPILIGLFKTAVEVIGSHYGVVHRA